MKPYPLSIIKEATSTIFLPKEYTASSSIKYLSFGTTCIECSIKVQKDEKKGISLSEDLFIELQIPYLGSTHLIQHEDTIYLGPLVGIFTAGFTKSMLRPIGERSLFFAKLLAVEKAVGAFPFIFGVHQINWEKGTINGLFYLKNGWKNIEVPFPNVVYDRLPNRRTESYQNLKEVKQRLNEEYLIPWFNPGFFNKWDIHQVLVNDSSVSHYLPETHLNPSLSLIEELLSKYQHVYLKPANGSLGLGVYQILYSRDEEAYYCRFKNDDNQNKLQKYSSLESLMKYVFRSKKLENYIVQQGVSLIRINHKTIDFRVHTNKDKDGKWQVSVIAAKVSGRGSVTTHLNSGGVVKTVDELYPSKSKCRETKQILQETAISISKAIDNHVKGPIGEIGFDLGIDKNGKVWLFEANSKPGRSIFSHPRLKENDFLTRKLSLQYAVHLTEKTIKSPTEVLK